MADQEWAPALDPQWRRDFGSLERGLDEFAALEHDCVCEYCHDLTVRRAWEIVTLWVFLPDAERTRWLDVYEQETRGVILRDVTARIGSERIMGLVSSVEQLRALGMIR